MRATIAVLASLGALATAKPIRVRQSLDDFAASTGFRLIANVTDLSRDLDPPIHGWAMVIAITEADNVGVPILMDPSSEINRFPTAGQNGLVWFLNGTDGSNEQYMQRGQICGDSNLVQALTVQNTTEYLDTHEHGVSVHPLSMSTAPPSTLGFAKSPDYPANYLFDDSGSDGTFMACMRPLSSAHTAPVIEYSYISCDLDSQQYTDNIPDDCAPITLLPQCDQLFSEDGTQYNQGAVSVPCFVDVASVDWSWMNFDFIGKHMCMAKQDGGDEQDGGDHDGGDEQDATDKQDA